MPKKKKATKINHQNYILFGVVVISLLFWNTPLVYPIKLFVVLIHEINHAVMAILSGGSVKSISLTFDLSGITITSGGNQILIAIAGYLGSLVVGVLLYLSTQNRRLRIWITTILASIILLVAANLMQGGLQIFLSLLVALFFFLGPRYLNEKFNVIFLKFLGLTSCFYVIVDIQQDLLTTSLRETDTQIIEYITGIPAILVGLSWFLISVIVVYFLLRKSLFN